MHGASREALVAARAALARTSAEGADAGALSAAADGLFAVVELLDREGSLRRALGDPTTSAEARDAMLDALLGGKVDPLALTLVKSTTAHRWSSARNLVDALEVLAATAVLLAAEKQGRLDRVSDELFRFERAVAGAPELRTVLTERGVDPSRKAALLDALLEGKADDATRRLLAALVVTPRGRTLEDGMAQYSELAADVRSRSLATVTTAVPLDAAQQERLAASLSAQLGRPVQLQVEVDRSLVGGVLVKVGDEVIDGSTRSRLAEARRSLA